MGTCCDWRVCGQSWVGGHGWHGGFAAGAGLSTVATPKSILPTVAGFHAELMTEPLEETEVGSISSAL